MPIHWGMAAKRPNFGCSSARNRCKTSPPPDCTICFTAPTKESVNRFHTAGLRNGGCDHGKPGPRPNYETDYYAAFLKDPDGYHALKSQEVEQLKRVKF